MVTVYEKNNRCGGLLMYGIPSMKIEKEVCVHMCLCSKSDRVQSTIAAFSINVLLNS